jgi:hypothetical protein
MTEQERQQVLKMIENGTITPEDGLKLMHSLDQNPTDEEAQENTAETPAPESSSGEEKKSVAINVEKSNFEADPRISKVKSTVSRLWHIPLWIGLIITILSAWGMYSLQVASKMNFWFFCLIVPLLAGVVLMAAALGSRKARWLFVDVSQKPGEKPSRIFLGFPLPLKTAAWLLRTFGNFIPPLKHSTMKVDDMVDLIETGISSDQPLVVNVDEGEEGERVKVYIG